MSSKNLMESVVSLPAQGCRAERVTGREYIDHLDGSDFAEVVLDIGVATFIRVADGSMLISTTEGEYYRLLKDL